MEQMDYDLMFRWFGGLGIEDPVWVSTMFTENCDRLLTTDMSRKVMAVILAHQGRAASVGRTLLGRWRAGESLGVDKKLPSRRLILLRLTMTIHTFGPPWVPRTKLRLTSPQPRPT